MKLLNEFYKAQADKDYKRVNELRIMIDQQAKEMPEVSVIGIAGTSLHHWQGGIGLPPSAIKIKGKWYLVDSNDSRRRKIILRKPCEGHGYEVLLGRLYHQKRNLQLLTIDDMLEMLNKQERG